MQVRANSTVLKYRKYVHIILLICMFIKENLIYELYVTVV